MNAIELADKLDLGHFDYAYQASCMLRYQVDEIKQVKTNLNLVHNKFDALEKEIEVLNQSYEILFKHRIEQEKENQLLKKEIKDF